MSNEKGPGVPGDTVTLAAGSQFPGRSGTVIRANGNNSWVALHGPGMVAVRDFHGAVYVVPADSLKPALIVRPKRKFLIGWIAGAFASRL